MFTEAEYRDDAKNVVAHAIATGRAIVARTDAQSAWSSRFRKRNLRRPPRRCAGVLCNEPLHNWHRQAEESPWARSAARCSGLQWVLKREDDILEAWCGTCGQQRVYVSGWQDTEWADGVMRPVRESELDPVTPPIN